MYTIMTKIIKKLPSIIVFFILLLFHYKGQIPPSDTKNASLNTISKQFSLKSPKKQSSDSIFDHNLLKSFPITNRNLRSLFNSLKYSNRI